MNAPRRLILMTLLIACAAPIFAERFPERYERMLVPVLPVGSWPAALWIRNDGSEPVDLFPLVRDADSPSRGRRFPLSEPGVPPGTTLDYFSFLSGESPYYMPLTSTYAGGVLYVEQGKRRNVRFQLRVGETQIPVVPEQDFVAAPMSLLQFVPVAGRRYTLRVYSLDEHPGTVQVTFEPSVGGRPVDPQVLRLERPEAAALCNAPPCPWPDVPFTPSWGAFFFDTSSVPSWNYRITVTPEPGVRIWMFLSETDPITRAIRVYVPN